MPQGEKALQSKSTWIPIRDWNLIARTGLRMTYVEINLNPYQGLKPKWQVHLDQLGEVLGRNQLESLSGIETWRSWLIRLTMSVEINLNPYQGLKQIVWVDRELLEPSKSTWIPIRDWNIEFESLLVGLRPVEINLNPYQGLKHSELACALRHNKSKSTWIPIRDWNLAVMAIAKGYWVEINLNPYQGLKLSPYWGIGGATGVEINLNPYQGLKLT